ncbi:MAG: NAD(P)-dependent oxidoreductase [Acidobacteria bacterium]|nr:NAD(P)-dependent oxidoreductase [Acidobacteriota bacterium]MBI3658097.1 NAD(P)-dependent oxidoreductase [Acidobacteriota bacterium]
MKPTIEPRHDESRTSTGEGVILFGGSGFLGPYILKNYPNIISVGRTPPPTTNRHIHIESLANLDVLRDVKFDKVIFIIGNTDHHNLEKENIPRGELTAFDYHVIPLFQALEQLKRLPIKKLIHFSTILLYRNPSALPVSEHAPIDPYKNRYVLSKYLAEEACKFYLRWTPIINVRLSNIYGPTPLPRFDLIHRLIRQLLQEGRGQVWSAQPERDFIYVEDAAHAIVKLLDTDYTGTLNLGTGVMTSVRRVITRLEELSGCPIVDLNQAVEGPMQFQCDMTTLTRLIDWKPAFSIDQGIQCTYERMLSWSQSLPFS